MDYSKTPTAGHRARKELDMLEGLSPEGQLRYMKKRLERD